MEHEEHAFREAMRADHNDRTSRLVYADWLDEHGQHVPAARIRAFDAAKYVIEPTSGDMATGLTSAHLHQLEPWQRRLAVNHLIHDSLRGTPSMNHAPLRDAMHASELHALGLADDNALADSHTRTITVSHRDTLPGRSAYATWLARNVSHPDNPLNTEGAIRDLAGAVEHHYTDERAGYLENRHNIMAQKLVSHFKKNPVRLARPGAPVKLGLVDFVKRLFGGKEPVRQPGDGIVHKASDPTAVYAEHNAVMQAIRLLGGTSVATPERARQYMNWIHGFAKAKPDHPLVRAYTDAANGWHTGGTAGPGMTEAVKPLVGAVNLLMHAHGKDSRFVKPVSEAIPTHVPPMSTHEASPSLPAYEVVDDPVDLSDVPPAPAEDRHTAVLRMTKEGKSKEEIAKHLMDVHGAPHQKAANASIRAAYARALALHQKAKGTGPTKLAAYNGGPIKPEHLTGGVASRDPVTGAAYAFHTPVEGTSLAYHLRQIAKDHPDLRSLTEAALTGQAHYSGRANAGPNGIDDPYHHIGKALSARSHPLAKAYDWSELAEQHRHDSAVEKAVNGIVKRTPLSELKHWDMIARADKSKNGEQFYQRLEKALGGKHGDREALKESIRRLQERALDRAYLGEVQAEGLRENKDFRSVMGAHR